MPTDLPALNRPIKLAVLISGGGTTLLNLLEKNQAGQLDAEFPIVIASREDCRGVERARSAGLHCEPVVRSQFDSVETFSERIFDLCRDAEVDLVILGGFLSLVQIPDEFAHRVINIHPSLIPAFCGKGFHGHHVHEAVLERGAKVSGCTVHFANNEYDAGPIILQKIVPVMDDDTPGSLQKRVFEAEREAFPEAIRLFATGRLRIDGTRVVSS
ncbi:MAG: phosphoribosylglycinamide formyltransferase [Planctomycetota bacterium]|nr:phosphoribosylglycinamide formyltransferase [Planctomycetota bacterium]MDA1163054.1 phosphoribosylglycinamide formyltransferase [Planctomycetota bacterium]